MEKSIYPCLWFDGNAKEALSYYCEVIANSKITADTPMVAIAELDGVKFMGLNGGPMFKPNASVSFMIIAETEEEVTRYWDHLSVGGSPLMQLGSYPWSAKYGWVKDQFGIDWQVYLGKLSDTGQRIVPTLMYCGEHQGQSASAIDFYRQLFTNSETQGVMNYADGWAKGQVQHAQFRLREFVLAAMDSGVPQDFTFNEGVSFVVECKDQVEIDHFWNSITERGQESRCGWCKDEFGVWWQIIPDSLGTLINDPVHGGKVAAALMKMGKIDLGVLETA